jgi:peptidoglycan/LPS O-acetylase OafA/YrhL
LRRFYLRRTLRIFPAYYAFLALVVVATALAWERFDYGNGLAAFTYTSDYFFPGPNTLDHSWSLAIEEQFYLLWPAALLFSGVQRARLIVLLAAVVCPVSRVVDLFIRMHGGAGLAIAPADYRFDTQADALAIGCLLALTRDWLHRQSAYLRTLAGPIMALVPLVILVLEEYDIHTAVHPNWTLYPFLLIGFTAMNIGIALCIDTVLTYPHRLAGKLFNWKPVVALGVVSYSLYIWQQIFLMPAQPAWFTRFPINLALAITAACASYIMIEKPVLRFRSRLDHHLFQQGRKPLATMPALGSAEVAAGITPPREAET